MAERVRRGDMRKYCGAVAALLVGSSLAHSQPDKVVYELQERCGKRAAEVFAKEWGSNVVNTVSGQTLANFENHYSPRLNKCFYLEISTSYEKSKQSFKTLRLFDLNDNKEYAIFLEGLTCDVRGKRCATEAEWRELVKPFMED
jgi:hypothetical protein